MLRWAEQPIARVGSECGSDLRLGATTQQSAALVEQSASAVVLLRDQADRLAEQVSVFRLQA
jgi:hypothetical protein